MVESKRHWDNFASGLREKRGLPSRMGHGKQNVAQTYENMGRRIRGLPPVTKQDGLIVGEEVGTSAPFALPIDILRTHLHIIGAIGTGKSFFMDSLIRQLISQRQGLCLIDPHGSLYDHVVNFLAHHPKYADRVILFDPTKPQEFWPGFNPLKRTSYFPDLTVQVRHIIGAAAKVWEEDSKRTPLLRRMMGNVLHPLIEGQQTFLEARYFLQLSDGVARTRLLKATSNARVQREWQEFENLSLARKKDALGSLQNRMPEFVDNEAVQLIMGRQENTIDIQDIVENRKVLLCNLSTRGGQLHRDDAFLIGCLMVSELTNFAFSRTEEQSLKNPFFLFLDEFQNFISPDMTAILDQCRKFGIHLILAHQHLSQLKEKDAQLYSSVMGSARNKVVFGGLSESDVEILERELFLGEHDLHEVKQEIYRTAIVDYDEESVTTSSHASTSGDSRSYGPGFFFPELLGLGDFASSTEAESQSTRPVPVFEEELSSREYYSLDQQRYKNQARLKLQPRQHAIFKLDEQPTKVVRLETVTEYRNDKRKLEALEERVLAAQSQYYLREVEIRALIEARQQAIEDEPEEPISFREPKKSSNGVKP